ncbi:CPBP family intramembrane glutamic endopeptidase [Halobaculum marinum]|uniref:CPBP family intramembrane glutamic endopeptidase n=1 Tax=Halobaculum marinum TaxID=3031996 RepID=A0ABD5WWG8_9EURY|nr:CPBP family intramembrane glutamic endopeptidase [Halobaculum sp. DT55]
MRGRDLWGYLLFSHGWTWLWWGVNVVAGLDAFGAGLPFTLLGGAGPLLGGVVMSRDTYGRAGLVDLGTRLVDPRRLSPRWVAVTVLLFPTLAVVAGAATAVGTGAVTVLDVSTLAGLLTSPAALASTVAVTLVVGPLPEEVGWRGYLLDRCQRRWSALAAALVVGVAWATWHAPLFVMPGYYEAFDFAPDPLPFGASLLCSSVLYAWVYDNTDRSVLAVVLLHFTENFVGQVTTLPPAGERVLLAAKVLLAVTVVAIFGHRTLRRDGSVPSPPPDRRRG